MASHQQRIEKISETLKNWDYQLDRLEHRLIDLSEEARQQAKEALADLKEQRKQMATRLEEGRSQAGEMLEDFKDGMEKTMDDFKERLQKMRHQVGDKDD
ncbi:hypothetical protein A11A3_01135 [Alcanivorax hongdengensis A-11-3]|uniref:Coiled coil domain-containing protein n=1 Tax=Alcanivorax hongdengensis A-11-3 TaxID=1177179 RepID=L0WJP0_9GAMM|nr:hypothetical protein [Alcanivorax hongdengensis]EKF76055.1 hypothetical protein A11A3_01135 [Alcanivorax hongdengensis A-11-3]